MSRAISPRKKTGLDPIKIKRAKRVLGTTAETETIGACEAEDQVRPADGSTCGCVLLRRGDRLDGADFRVG